MSGFIILPVGEPPREMLKRSCAALSAILEAETRLADAPLDPAFAYLPERGQYYSTRILAQIDEMNSEYPGRVIGVTERDLCIPILQFVFGEAQLGGRAAVVSTLRLNPAYYGLRRDDLAVEDRLLREMLHEIGHTYGLRHCEDWGCVMHTANTVDEIDIRGPFFCDYCAGKIL